MKKQSIIMVVTTAALSVSLATYGASLVQYWNFNDGDGATVANAVSNGNAGALINFNESGWNSDRPAVLTHSTGSLAFNSLSNNYINGGHLGLSATGTVGELTMSFWIKPQTLDDTRLLSQLEFPSKNPSGAVQINAGGKLHLLKVSDLNAASFSAISPTGAISTGIWQHVAFTWRGKQATCYVSGNCVGTKFCAIDYDRDTDGNILTFGIGAKFKSTYGSSYNGKIDDMAIWNKALSSSQIRQLSNGRSPLLIDLVVKPALPPLPLVEYRLDGSAYDKRGGYHGMVTNGAVFVDGTGNTPFSYAGNMALQFDGVNDEVILPNVTELSPSTNAWTLSLWFKAEAADQQGVLIANRQDAAPWTQIGIYIGGSVIGHVGQGRLIHVIALGVGQANRWEACTLKGYADGYWHHIALTRGNNDRWFDLFVDGEQVPLNVMFDLPLGVTDIKSTDPWRIGSNGAYGGYFKGLIDEVAMWDTDLTAGQISWLAQKSITILSKQGTLIMVQ